MGIRTIGAHYLRLGVIIAGLLIADRGSAQNPPPSTPPTPPPPATADEGKDIGGFHVTQSIEFGGRINDVSGSQAMYDTLVNLQSGARILEQSLTMQSLTHQDIFDSLSMNSFGWGGDPEQALRLRVSKYGWYNFSGSYQHMQNYFDYDLLANPLNPSAGASPYIPILTSPHAFYNRQNLYNFDIVILPMHRLSFRLGYNRNRISGPSFSSVHQGTDSLNNDNWDTTLNGFRFGADFRVNKKTTLSYTQLLQYYAGGQNSIFEHFQFLAAFQWQLGHLRPAMVQQRKPVQRAADQRNRQSCLQWVHQLQPLSARQYFHPHRAGEPDVVFAEVVGL